MPSSDVSPSREMIVAQIAEPMRAFAVENPCLTHEAVNAAAVSGKFSRFVRVKNTLAIYVLLTISPSERETDAPFWHCSMSLVSAATGRPKTVGLWTTAELKNIRRLLPEFLGEAGDKDTQGFLRTKTALHCCRNMTAAEVKQLGKVDK